VSSFIQQNQQGNMPRIKNSVRAKTFFFFFFHSLENVTVLILPKSMETRIYIKEAKRQESSGSSELQRVSL